MKSKIYYDGYNYAVCSYTIKKTHYFKIPYRFGTDEWNEWYNGYKSGRKKCCKNMTREEYRSLSCKEIKDKQLTFFDEK